MQTLNYLDDGILEVLLIVEKLHICSSTNNSPSFQSQNPMFRAHSRRRVGHTVETLHSPTLHSRPVYGVTTLRHLWNAWSPRKYASLTMFSSIKSTPTSRRDASETFPGPTYTKTMYFGELTPWVTPRSNLYAGLQYIIVDVSYVNEACRPQNLNWQNCVNHLYYCYSWI